MLVRANYHMGSRIIDATCRHKLLSTSANLRHVADDTVQQMAEAECQLRNCGNTAVQL